MRVAFHVSLIAGVIVACGLTGACNSLEERPLHPSSDAAADASGRDAALADAASSDAATLSDGSDGSSNPVSPTDAAWLDAPVTPDAPVVFVCPNETPTCTAPARTYEQVQPILAQCVACHEAMKDYITVHGSRQNLLSRIQSCSMTPNTIEEWRILLNWFACGAPQDGVIEDASTGASNDGAKDGNAGTDGSAGDGALGADVWFGSDAPANSSVSDASLDGAHD
jgi:hypothetical protein